ncbi:MAG: 50S ribosomal protein L21 [Firmicutes bacterium]|nr:50S ribosomal protein L21 [Bacillota bacterium]
MYAVIESGGKQYRVTEGQSLRVERLEAEPGAQVTLDRLLVLGEGADVKIGTPYVEGARVTARVLEQGKGRKILVLRYKPKKNERRRRGHRQPYTRILIEKIEDGSDRVSPQ